MLTILNILHGVSTFKSRRNHSSRPKTNSHCAIKFCYMWMLLFIILKYLADQSAPLTLEIFQQNAQITTGSFSSKGPERHIFHVSWHPPTKFQDFQLIFYFPGLGAGHILLNSISVNVCNFHTRQRGTVLGLIAASYFVGKGVLICTLDFKIQVENS